MASSVTNGTLDAYYAKVRKAGAEGGKILGAGAGGCLLVCVPSRHQSEVRRVMVGSGLTEIPFTMEPEGSKIIYVGG